MKETQNHVSFPVYESRKSLSDIFLVLNDVFRLGFLIFLSYNYFYAYL